MNADNTTLIEAIALGTMIGIGLCHIVHAVLFSMGVIHAWS